MNLITTDRQLPNKVEDKYQSISFSWRKQDKLTNVRPRVTGKLIPILFSHEFPVM